MWIRGLADGDANVEQYNRLQTRWRVTVGEADIFALHLIRSAPGLSNKEAKTRGGRQQQAATCASSVTVGVYRPLLQEIRWGPTM